MTEHNNKDNCITRDVIMRMHSIVINDTGLTSEDIRDVWDRVGTCIGKGNVAEDRAINPMVACEDEFDMNSMIAGAMIIIGVICVGMSMHEELVNKEE